MSLLLYADECVDARIVNGLRRRGIDVVSVVEEGSLGASDEHHLERASELGRVVLTADQDFLRLAHERAMAGVQHPGLFYLLPATPVGEAVRAIAMLCVAMTADEMVDWIEWIP